MEHGIHLATYVFDSCTDLDATTLEDHISESGHSWFNMGDGNIIITSNTITKTTNPMSFGITSPRSPKKVSIRLASTRVTPSLGSHLFVMWGDVTDPNVIPIGTIAVEVQAGLSSVSTLKRYTGVAWLTIGGSQSLTTSVGNLVFETLVIERYDTTLRCYFEADLAESIVVDMAEVDDVIITGKTFNMLNQTGNSFQVRGISFEG